jgi:hypothetical protein
MDWIVTAEPRDVAAATGPTIGRQLEARRSYKEPRARREYGDSRYLGLEEDMDCERSFKELPLETLSNSPRPFHLLPDAGFVGAMRDKYVVDSCTAGNTRGYQVAQHPALVKDQEISGCQISLETDRQKTSSRTPQVRDRALA